MQYLQNLIKFNIDPKNVLFNLDPINVLIKICINILTNLGGPTSVDLIFHAPNLQTLDFGR